MDKMDKMDIDVITKFIKRVSNKDSNAYKVTEYYIALTTENLDEGGIALARAKILNIEKDLRKWVKEYPNEGATIMQPEDSALGLIDDLRAKGLLDGMQNNDVGAGAKEGSMG
jgi:hypothetical protein